MAGVFWRSHMNNRRFLAVFSGIILSATLVPSDADAQRRYNLYSPGSNRPSVIVDLTVLDKLGPEPTLPKMLRPFLPQSSGAITATLTPVTPASRQNPLLPPPNEPPKSSVSLPPELKQRPIVTARTTKRTPPPTPSIAKPAQAQLKAPKLSPPNLAPPKRAAEPKRTGPKRNVAVPPPAPKLMAPKITPPKITPPKIAAITPKKRRVAPPPKLPAPVAKMAPPPAAPKITAPRVAPPKVAAPKPAPPKPAPKSTTSKIAKRSAVPPPPKLKKPTRPQVALAGPATATASNGTLQIRFNVNSSDLPSNATSALDGLVKKLKGDPNLRIQLHGYASGPTNSPSQARRLSLFRALSVRTHLMKSGVRSTRIDVRALGVNSSGGPKDRVDVLFPQS
jgi:outer membrane protein OmpA-like peptidoglycan-associated protein